MKRIAVIGAGGYVGSALFEKLQKDKNNNVTGVTRSNYSYWQKRKFDIVINAAMSSARLWAEEHPDRDFIESVKKTADIIYNWKYKKLVQISTISARSELDRVYGRHKAAAENLCSFGDNLIIRLTATYGDTLQKGAVVDILNGRKVWVDAKSRYSFASLDFVSGWVATHLELKGTIEVGARNSLSLARIARHLGLMIPFQGKLDHQEVQNPLPEFPEAKEILKYLKKRINNI